MSGIGHWGLWVGEIRGKREKQIIWLTTRHFFSDTEIRRECVLDLEVHRDFSNVLVFLSNFMGR